MRRALAAARTIPYDRERSWPLAAVAGQLAAADPARTAALLDQALAAAETIPYDWARSEASARIHATTRSSMLDELSPRRLGSLGASINLLNMFPEHSHDKAIAESIGLAVGDVAVEFSAET